jgi:xanthine dehydrogenase accessory factor
VEQLLAGPPGCDVDELEFVGMIGSRGKVGRFRKRMEMRGLLEGTGAARWARMKAPVGLDIGAETPEEIAIAVVAQLVAVRRRGEAAAGTW